MQRKNRLHSLTKVKVTQESLNKKRKTKCEVRSFISRVPLSISEQLASALCSWLKQKEVDHDGDVGDHVDHDGDASDADEDEADSFVSISETLITA